MFSSLVVVTIEKRLLHLSDISAVLQLHLNNKTITKSQYIIPFLSAASHKGLYYVPAGSYSWGTYCGMPSVICLFVRNSTSVVLKEGHRVVPLLKGAACDLSWQLLLPRNAGVAEVVLCQLAVTIAWWRQIKCSKLNKANTVAYELVVLRFVLSNFISIISFFWSSKFVNEKIRVQQVDNICSRFFYEPSSCCRCYIANLLSKCFIFNSLSNTPSKYRAKHLYCGAI